MKREELKEWLLSVGNQDEKEFEQYNKAVSESLSYLKSNNHIDIDVKRRLYYALTFYKDYALTMSKINHEKNNVLLGVREGKIKSEIGKKLIEEYTEDELELLDRTKNTIIDVKGIKGLDYQTFFRDVVTVARYSHELVGCGEKEYGKETIEELFDYFVNNELMTKKNSSKR